MRYLIAILSLTLLLAPSLAHAKRGPPPKIEPVVYGGVRYVVPNDNGRQAYIQAWDKSTNHMLWSATVFRNAINPLLEEDVQWVFVKTLKLEHGNLIVVDERDRAYSVDLKTHAVRELPKARPEKPPTKTSALHRTDAPELGAQRSARPTRERVGLAVLCRPIPDLYAHPLTPQAPARNGVRALPAKG